MAESQLSASESLVSEPEYTVTGLKCVKLKENSAIIHIINHTCGFPAISKCLLGKEMAKLIWMQPLLVL